MNTKNSHKNFNGFRSFYSFFIGLLLLVLSVGDLVGQSATITINLTSAGGTTNLGTTNYASGAERTWIQSGVTFGGKAVTGNGSNIQAQANNGVIYNISALPGAIKTIQLNQTTSTAFSLFCGSSTRLVNSTAANYTVTGGTAEGTITGTTWTSSDLSASNYTFFALKKGGTAAQISSITITYVTGSSVTFNSNGGSGTMADQTASVPTSLTANSFTRTGYTFSGWNTATDGSGTSYADEASFPFTATTTLFAQWTPTSGSNVTFNANGGVGTMAQQNASSATDLTANAFTRSGYTFTGWNTAADGSGTVYVNLQSYSFASDLTLYAQWQINAPILVNQSFSGIVGNLFTENPTNTGGTANTWTLSSGSLPSGISLNASTGQLSGTPSVSGTFTFSLNASNATSNSTASYTLSISSVPSSLANYLFTGTSCSVAAFSPSSVVANTSFSNISTNSITCNTNAANSFSGSSSWGTAFSSTRYIEFTVTPSSGYLVTLTSLNFDVWRSGAGATSVVLRSSLDSYVADLATESVTTTSANKTVTLSSSFVGLNSAITFRIYGFGGNSTGDLRLDNINLLGYVYPACTPPADPAGTFNLTSNCGNTDIEFSPTLPVPSGVDYFWQSSANGVSTAVSDAISVTKNTTSNATFYVRAYHSGDNCWSTNASSQLVTIVSAPTISTQPSNTSVVSGNTASFSVSATNASSFQWQVNTGTGWNDVTTGIGATTANYQTDAVVPAMNGYVYRVIVTGISPCTPINSNGLATLTVTSPTVNVIANQSNIYGSSVSITATATGAVSSWSATLPAGLSINSSGVISGTLTENVAGSPFSSSVTANFTAGGSDTKLFTWTITPKALTISGLSGTNKVYDGTNSATLSGTGTLIGIVGADVVTLSGTPTGTFANKNVGTNKSITVSGYTLSGAQAGNYTLTQPTGLTANITQKSVTVTGATAQDKVYNTTTAATISGATLVGIIGSDAVTVSGGGTFATANAGTGIAVTAALSLSGLDAGNYILTQPTGLSANITKANPVFTTSPIAVTVGGTYNLPGASVSSTSDGALSYTITAGGNATLAGTTITGAVVGTETLTVNQAASANYNAGSTTVVVNVTTFNNGDYRTAGGGNWHSTAASNDANWEQFNGTSWVSSSAPATNAVSLGSRTVYIRDSIYLVGTNTAPNVVVENGGILHTSTISATFGNLLVKTGGKFYRQGNGSGISGTFEVEDNAIVYFFHTNTTSRSSSIWAGTEKFHSNSNFIIRSSQNTAGFLIIESNSDISEYNGACFGNLYIDLGAGKMNLIPTGFTKTLANNLYFLRGTDNFIITSGTSNLNILNHFVVENTFNYNITCLSASGTLTSSIGGDLINNSTRAFRLTNGSASTTNMIVEGNTLINSGSIEFSEQNGGASVLDLRGDLYVGGTLTYYKNGTGSVNHGPTSLLKFSAAANQDVYGTGTLKIYNAEVNKSGEKVNLLRDVRVEFNLKMTQGHVYTNANLLELGESTTQKGTLTYTSGYVVGKMRRWFAGTNSGTSTGLFPMGVDESGLKNRFSLIEYASAPATGGHLTVEFLQVPMLTPAQITSFLIPAVNSGGFGYDVTSVEDQGYWKIDNQAGTLTDGAYSISCTGEGFETITDLSQITLLKRVGAGDWFCPGNHEASSGSTAVPTVRRSGVVGYSNFGFGAPMVVNPLPVELTKFEASCSSDGILVTWETASEKNASHFDLETSIDGETWNRITSVSAVGNSTQTQQYAFNDVVRASIQYYRLSQVDLNGATEMYQPIAVQCEMNANVLVYPNPVQGQLQLLNLGSNGATISISTTEGRTVYASSTNQNFVQIPTENFESGTYFVHIRLADGTTVLEKIIKQ